MRVRVWVPDVWDSLALDVTPDATFEQVKIEGLAKAKGRSPDSRAYEIKYRGARVADESQTLRAFDVPDGAPLIVLPTRRRPVT